MQFPPDLVEQVVIPRATTVDLVGEDQERDLRRRQRLRQPSCLRLHALDGGHHQDHPIEHAERPLHLGDEVRVAGRVDKVDLEVADPEGDDGGLDRDTALAFELERVGLGCALINAADLADNTGVEQDSFG